MKLRTLIFMTMTLYCVFADDMRSCITDADCESDECCISLVFVRGFCHTLGKEGDHCIAEPAITEHGKKNLFGCPCTDGFSCVSDISEKEDGTVVYRNPKCKAIDA